MKRLILAMSGLLALSACEKHHDHKDKVIHASDGSYWKQDESGNWLLFYMLATSNNAYTSTQTTLPKGGSWVRSNSPPSVPQLKGSTEEEEDGEGGETEPESGSGESSESGSDDSGSDASGSDGGGDDSGGGDSGGGSSE